MKRGDLYRVYRGYKNDPKKHRVFLVVSRQTLIDQKSLLTDYIGSLSSNKMQEVNTALRIALAIG